MDFGVMGFLDNNLLCSNDNNNAGGGFTIEQENGSNEYKKQQQQQKCCGSRRTALLTSHDCGDDADISCFRDFKVAKTTITTANSNTSSSSCGETMLKIPLLQRSSNSGSEGHQQQQMLSFSSPTATLPYYHSASNAAFFSRNTGCGSGVINSGGSCMKGPGVLRGGPFTPSQWMELEHQALIYKHITANVPIPSYLLNPIRKAFESAGFSVLPSGALGWGGFHLGFGSTSDPEPGRCRRTDGKKWRCSRDAVADQKYCERHMNRGRHRSRKPVEAQQSAAAAVGHSATTTTLTSGKPPAPPITSSSSMLLTGGLGLLRQHQLGNLHRPGASTNPHLSGIPKSNRSHENTDGMHHQHTRFVSTAASSPKVDSPKEDHHSITKPLNPEFGLVCSDSLLNPLVNFRNYDHYHNLNDPPQSNKYHQQHALLQFMDNWPKSQTERTSWPDSIGMQLDRTELSISIPVAASPPASPLRLSREVEMGPIANQRQTDWAWEPSSVGGPLGEVLHNTSSTTREYCNTGKAALNLMEMWDSSINSHHLASSPTGVLQRGTFGSLSNSSAGSSPRAESHGLIGQGFMNPSLPDAP